MTRWLITLEVPARGPGQTLAIVAALLDELNDEQSGLDGPSRLAGLQELADDPNPLQSFEA